MCLRAQSCLTLCNPTDCSPPGSSVRGTFPGKSGLPFPAPGDLADPRIELASPASPTLAGWFSLSHLGSHAYLNRAVINRALWADTFGINRLPHCRNWKPLIHSFEWFLWKEFGTELPKPLENNAATHRARFGKLHFFFNPELCRKWHFFFFIQMRSHAITAN